MRALMGGVVAPCRNRAAGLAQRREQVFVQALRAHPAIEAFHETILQEVSCAMECRSAFRSSCPLRIALLVRSVPLSETSMQG